MAQVTASRSNVAVVLFLAAVFCPTGLGLGWSILWEYSWRDTTPHGPLMKVTDWPRPISDLYASLNDSGVDTASFSVYLLHGQPGQTLSTVVCRIDIDDDGWETIRRSIELQPIPLSQCRQLRHLIASTAGAAWWPGEKDDAAYYASARRLAGDEGDLYYAAREKSTSRAFIHYHYNF